MARSEASWHDRKSTVTGRKDGKRGRRKEVETAPFYSKRIPSARRLGFMWYLFIRIRFKQTNCETQESMTGQQ
eukprot:833998-Pyramimonas_sp.AAC.1